MGSVISSTDHSAHPVLTVSPRRAASRSLVKTVPTDTAVGGVPQNRVCGFRLSVTTYFSAVSWSSVYSWASSITSRSKPSPKPPLEDLVRKSTDPPPSPKITIRSRPICFVYVKCRSYCSSFFTRLTSWYPASVSRAARRREADVLVVVRWAVCRIFSPWVIPQASRITTTSFLPFRRGISSPYLVCTHSPSAFTARMS